MRGDATSNTTRFAFFELLSHLCDRPADIKAGAKWFDAFRAQRLKFFSSERDQLVFVFHIRTANVRRGAWFATLNRELLIEVLPSTSNPRYCVCQRNTCNEIVRTGRPHELLSRRHDSNDCQPAANEFQAGRAAGETVLDFSAEQSWGDVGNREAAQHASHARCRPKRVGIHRLSYCADHRERPTACRKIIQGKQCWFRRK